MFSKSSTTASTEDQSNASSVFQMAHDAASRVQSTVASKSLLSDAPAVNFTATIRLTIHVSFDGNSALQLSLPLCQDEVSGAG